MKPTAVVDASALVASVSTEDTHNAWAVAVIPKYRLAAPHHVLVESCNTLRKLELMSKISQVDAASDLHALRQVKLELYRFEPYADRIWSLRENLTPYDAAYVALAEELDCPLLTTDMRLLRAPGPRCKFIAPPPRMDGLPVQQATSSTVDSLRDHGSFPHTEHVAAQITIRNVPSEVRDRIKARAESRGQSMQAHILSELESNVRYATTAEWIRLIEERHRNRTSNVSNKEILEVLHEVRGD